MLIEWLLLITASPYLSYGRLVMPHSAPTRHQLILGVGVPLNLEHEAVTYGWTVKAQYFLPASTGQQLKWPFSQKVWKNYKGKGKREALTDKLSGQKYRNDEMKIGNLEINENDLHDDIFDDQIDHQGRIPKLSDYPLKTEAELLDTSGTRWLLYDGFGRMLTTKGLEGRCCVLRSICEAAESNFGIHNGLFGELSHLFFTPSSTSDVIINREHYDYLKAEMLGQAGEPCDQIFHQCQRSVLEIFTKVYDLDMF